jgi:gas vesicle protein
MSNKFWKGMLLGAIAGGALTLFDKETRQAMKENGQKAAELIKNPKQTYEQVKEAAIQIKSIVEQVTDDLSYITEKVDELRETTPQVTKILKETKHAFSKDADIEEEDWEL